MVVIMDETSRKGFWHFYMKLIFIIYIWAEVAEMDKLKGFVVVKQRKFLE